MTEPNRYVAVIDAVLNTMGTWGLSRDEIETLLELRSLHGGEDVPLTVDLEELFYEPPPRKPGEAFPAAAFRKR